MGGFTLAEVLITLGIIGIVAAMTLPVLIANHREKQKVTQLKKVYSVLQQAFLLAQSKHGESKYWGEITTTDTGETDENGNPILDYSTSNKFLNYIAEGIKGKKSDVDLILTIAPMNKNTGTKTTKPPELYLTMPDGTLILAGYSSGEFTTMDIATVFPGCLKSVCKYGIDIFYFKVDLDKGKIVPFGGNDTTLNTGSFEKKCNMAIENTQQGFGCTAWVLQNENMDYLRCNDLNWNTKTSCK